MTLLAKDVFDDAQDYIPDIEASARCWKKNWQSHKIHLPYQYLVCYRKLDLKGCNCFCSAIQQASSLRSTLTSNPPAMESCAPRAQGVCNVEAEPSSTEDDAWARIPEELLAMVFRLLLGDARATQHARLVCKQWLEVHYSLPITLALSPPSLAAWLGTVWPRQLAASQEDRHRRPDKHVRRAGQPFRAPRRLRFRQLVGLDLRGWGWGEMGLEKRHDADAEGEAEEEEQGDGAARARRLGWAGAGIGAGGWEGLGDDSQVNDSTPHLCSWCWKLLNASALAFSN